jgi:hypothetical protein
LYDVVPLTALQLTTRLFAVAPLTVGAPGVDGSVAAGAKTWNPRMFDDPPSGFLTRTVQLSGVEVVVIETSSRVEFTKLT